MKALIVDSPGVARVTDIPEPVAAAGELALQVRRIGLCGTDLNTFRGANPLVTFPRILGHEVSATVHAESPLAGTAWSAGQNVCVSPYTACGHCSSCLHGRPNACRFNQTLGVQRDGAMTERITTFAAKLYTGNLDLNELCLVEPLTVGFHAVARGKVTSADTVAVLGCGAIGLGAISGAAFQGAHVIAIDMDDKKLETAVAAGAIDTINTAHENLHERLGQITSGHGPDCVIEAIGLPQTFRAAVEEVAFGGRVVYIGYAKEPVAYETKLFVQKELEIYGSRNALDEDFSSVIRMLEAKRFPVAATITRIVSIEEVPAMLRQWNDDPSRFTKIMVQIS